MNREKIQFYIESKRLPAKKRTISYSKSDVYLAEVWRCDRVCSYTDYNLEEVVVMEQHGIQIG